MKKTAAFLSVIIIITAVMLSCTKTNPTNPAATATAVNTNTPQATFTNTIFLTATPTSTVTPTSTATPNYGTLSGNLVLPAAQLGVAYQVLIDTDMNFANGITVMTAGICGVSASVPYSLTITPGTYYVYALVKTAGCAQCPPEAGDYLGWLGAVYPANPASANVVITANTVLSAQNISMVAAVNNVTGDIATASDCDGKNFLIAADTDADPSSGVFYLKVAAVSGTQPGPPFTFTYNALCYFPGSFYFTAEIATNGHSLPGAPQSGDFVGNVGPVVIDPSITNSSVNIIAPLFP